MAKLKKPNKAFKGTTHFVLVWDESGSMAGLTQAGNDNIEEQLSAARDAENVKFSLWFFGTHIPGNSRLVVDAQNPKSVNVKSLGYRPTGGTPLYDAVGKAIRHVEGQMKKGDRVLFIVFTDGHENSSTEWGKDQVGKLVAEKEADDYWTLVFNAAGFSAWDAEYVARNMGFSGQTVMVASASPQGMKGMSSASAVATTDFLRSADTSKKVGYYSGTGPVVAPDEEDELTPV